MSDKFTVYNGGISFDARINVVTYEEGNGGCVQVYRSEDRLFRENGKVVVMAIFQCGESKFQSGKSERSGVERGRMFVGGWGGWASDFGNDRGLVCNLDG